MMSTVTRPSIDRTTRGWLVMVATVAALSVGAARVHAQGKPVEPPVLGKIAVTAQGAVSFDGQPITIEALKAKLADLRKRDGVVWYYREGAASDPSPEAEEVIKLVTAARLPMSMSTKSDYSDVLSADGTIRPRAGVVQTATDGRSASPNTWSARSSTGQTFGGTWTATPDAATGAVRGTWTLVNAQGKEAARGSWSAAKSATGWTGGWRAVAAGRPGEYSGTWTAKVPLKPDAPFAALFEQAVRDVVSGTWQAGKQSGAWSIRAFKS